MSGVVDGLTKAFKKVVNVAKKVAPYALAAAAIYFTAGAAFPSLGLAGAGLGGWEGAASALVGKMGATGLLGQVLTGAVTQAGYGSIIGGLAAGVMGGDMAKGMQMGALTGAVSGGAMGGMGFQTDPLAGIGERGAEAAASSSGLPVVDAPASAVPKIGPISRSGLPVVSAPQAAGPSIQAAPGVAGSGGGAAAASGAGFFGKEGWLERNQALMGPVIQRVGSGLLAGATAGDEADAQSDLERERRQAIAANYGSGQVPGYRAAATGSRGGLLPTVRFDPQTQADWEWAFDPSKGKIVRVPRATPQP